MFYCVIIMIKFWICRIYIPRFEILYSKLLKVFKSEVLLCCFHFVVFLQRHYFGFITQWNSTHTYQHQSKDTRRNWMKEEKLYYICIMMMIMITNKYPSGTIHKTLQRVSYILYVLLACSLQNLSSYVKREGTMEHLF